jgi:hypothetical protein
MFAAVGPVDRRKTLIKSIRMEKELGESLERIARDRGLTLNSLITSALFRYLEWDSQTDTFGYVSLPHEIFREILYTDSDKQIEELGRTLGPRLIKENLQFWFKQINMESFLQFMGLVSKYSGLARCRIELDDDEYVLTYRHQLGERWSRFTSAFYGEGLRRILGVDPNIDVGSNQVLLRWKRANPAIRVAR